MCAPCCLKFKVIFQCSLADEANSLATASSRPVSQVFFCTNVISDLFESSLELWYCLKDRPGFHYQNAAAPNCLFVSLHDVGVTLVPL